MSTNVEDDVLKRSAEIRRTYHFSTKEETTQKMVSLGEIVSTSVESFSKSTLLTLMDTGAVLAGFVDEQERLFFLSYATELLIPDTDGTYVIGMYSAPRKMQRNSVVRDRSWADGFKVSSVYSQVETIRRLMQIAELNEKGSDALYDIVRKTPGKAWLSTTKLRYRPTAGSVARSMVLCSQLRTGVRRIPGGDSNGAFANAASTALFVEEFGLVKSVLLGGPNVLREDSWMKYFHAEDLQSVFRGLPKDMLAYVNVLPGHLDFLLESSSSCRKEGVFLALDAGFSDIWPSLTPGEVQWLARSRRKAQNRWISSTVRNYAQSEVIRNVVDSTEGDVGLREILDAYL